MDFLNKRTWFGLITVLGLLAFELFNYATTQEALSTILGALSFFGFPVYYLIAIAFAAIDLGGLSSTFTEEDWSNETWWVWVSTVGWEIASVVNAALTYMSVTIAMAVAPVSQLATVMPKVQEIYTYIPAALAFVVWLVRIMLIGSIVASTNGGQKPKKQRPIQQVAAAPTRAQAQRPMQPAPVRSPVTITQIPVGAPRQSNREPSSGPNNGEDDVAKLLGI